MIEKTLNINKRILVTGGAGFLGSHLFEKHIRFGNEVICLDNFYTRSKMNISKLDWESKINLEQGLKKTIQYFKSVM